MEKQERQTTEKTAGSETIDTGKMKSVAADVVDEAKSRGRKQFEAGKDKAAEQTEKLAGAVDRIAEDLDEGEQQSLADYAGQLAGSMRHFAENLRGRSLDDLIGDTQQLARNNPTGFLMGSVAVGIALSRFLKASRERGPGRHAGSYTTSRSEGEQGTSQSISSMGTEPGSATNSPSEIRKGV
ncbi:MAG: hypothetical protein GEU77_03650 [Deltaproteobacteria bacterium]|nr:hypothetical protein [Deltaproteobacteria bacterium]